MGAVERAQQTWGAAAIAKGKLSYDPLRFYTRGSDDKGHYEKLWIKVSPELLSMINRFCHADEFPDYKSPQDFIRDAAVHLVNMRQEQSGDPELRAAIEVTKHRHAFQEFIERTKSDLEQWESMHETLRETLTKCARAGAWDFIATHLDEAAEMAEGAPEPFYSQTMTIIKEWRERLREKR